LNSFFCKEFDFPKFLAADENYSFLAAQRKDIALPDSLFLLLTQA
jgi:hypothetical protein